MKPHLGSLLTLFAVAASAEGRPGSTTGRRPMQFMLFYQGTTPTPLLDSRETLFEQAAAEVDDLDTFAWRGADLSWGRKP